MAGSLHCSALPISECLLWRRAAAEKAAYREAKAKALEDELEQIALTAERKDAALAAREAAIEKKRIRDKKIRDEEVRLKMIEHEKELVEKAKEEGKGTVSVAAAVRRTRPCLLRRRYHHSRRLLKRTK